jgi:hypothetical protein
VNEFENNVLAEFNVDNAWRHIEHLVENLAGRHTGAEQEKRSAEYIAEQLREAGLKPEIQAVDSWLGVPRDAFLRISSPLAVEFPCASDTGHGCEVTAEFIVIESADEARTRRDEIKGRVVVIPYSYSYPITPEEVRKQSGVGVIFGNWGPADVDILRVTAPQTWTYWGLPDPEAYRLGEEEAVPQAHIGRKSYETLRQMCREGTVKGTFKSTIESFWGKSHQVIADVEPAHGEASDDFLIMAAHHDSWYPGASDDAAGVGTLLEAARVLHGCRQSLRRKVRFMFVSGHENGAYATTTWYLDNHWREINDHAICFSFTDTPGFANAPEFKIEVSEELSRFAERCARDIVGAAPTINVHRGNKTADRGFYGIGVPSIYTRCAFTKAQADEWGGAFLGYWNHSDHDTIDKIDRENLQTNAHIRLLEAIRLAGEEGLPYDFRDCAKGMRERLEEWQAAGLHDVGGTLKLLDDLEARIGRLHEAIKAKTHPARTTNDVLKRLSRILTWTNYTYQGRYGQDIFGVNVAKPLTIMNSIDELVHHDAGSPMGLMLSARIRRDQNKVEDAFVEAIELLDPLN